MTNDLQHLNIWTKNYQGTDQVQVGNGQGLQISKTGSSQITTANSTFVHNQILLVSQIQKSLLSIQHFCTYNNVYFEFHASFFLVNDYLGKVFHQGHLHNGLYHFTAPSCYPQALFSFVYPSVNGIVILVMHLHRLSTKFSPFSPCLCR